MPVASLRRTACLCAPMVFDRVKPVMILKSKPGSGGWPKRNAALAESSRPVHAMTAWRSTRGRPFGFSFATTGAATPRLTTKMTMITAVARFAKPFPLPTPVAFRDRCTEFLDGTTE